jgi:hypothetical protein
VTQDFKLGFRMLLKYPGLTLAGGLALTIAIASGAGWYQLWGNLLSPAIPLPEGDRLVIVETRNTLTNQPEPRVARDFLEWRRELRTLDELGAYRRGVSNLIVAAAAPLTIRSAEMTPGAFRAARVAPLLGRGLQDADAMPGAPAVVVVGHDLWRRSLGGRADVVGSIVTLGGTPATVIGVMPEDFGYPYSQQAWTPLRLRASYGPPRRRTAHRDRPAGARCHAGTGRCRAAGAQRASGIPARGDPRAPAIARRPALRRRWEYRRAARGEKPAGAVPAARHVHERRHAHLRTYRDARG